MKTCETCKHWKRLSDDFLKSRLPRMGKCDHPAFLEDGDDNPCGLNYGPMTGWGAAFETGQDFGCIHHAPKEVKP